MSKPNRPLQVPLALSLFAICGCGQVSNGPLGTPVGGACSSAYIVGLDPRGAAPEEWERAIRALESLKCSRGETERILRRHGYVIVRSGTRDGIGNAEYLHEQSPRKGGLWRLVYDSRPRLFAFYDSTGMTIRVVNPGGDFL